MGFNRYILIIIIRSLLIAFTALAMMFFAINLNWIFTFVFICLLFILQIILLIRYVSKVNRDLANFLIHLKEQNTSINFSSKSIDKIFGGLTKEFEKINEEFKKVETEKIKKENLLKLILNQIGTGILIINSNNEIKLYNKAILSIIGADENVSDSIIHNEILELLKDSKDLKVGNQNIITVRVNNITRKILVALSQIKEDNDSLRIFSFHDIDREITDYELQSWNGLIKVLSHEIMNTLTPISTTVDTLKDCFAFEENIKKVKDLHEKDIKDTIKGISILENRIDGLQNFIVKFRQFIDIPIPDLNPFKVESLFNNVSEIYNKEEVNVITNLKNKSIVVQADYDLIELVLINIIKNGIEANASEISLSSEEIKNHIIISVQDNGDGIESQEIKKVFLPFYTTKKEGSGIGLSFSRQVMFAHKGNIEIDSTTEGICVKLIFPR